MCETPERASAEVQCDPTPPSPMIMTNEVQSLVNRGGVRKDEVRVNCSAMRSEREELASQQSSILIVKHLHHSHRPVHA